ncbi:MAG TPA: methyltransferase domain-containing protein [Spirochaetia bacterium]|nr:methyltransferase domain-containing protein [Spirochaetia bacterium]
MGENREYSWDAEQYARNSTAQFQWAEELLGKLSLRGDERILDIGCGDGKVSAELARRVPQGAVVGVDSSEDMIRKAQAAFPSSSSSSLSFLRMDARELSFREEFDVVFSNAVLHWIKDHGPVLSGVARSLRPGGRLLFQMGGKGNGEEIFSVAAGIVRATGWEQYFRGFDFPWGFFGPQEYALWLSRAGLAARRIELFPRDMRQNGRDGLLGWVRTTWMPYTERLPENLKEQFLGQVADRYLAVHPLTPQGEAVVRMVRLEVEADKAGPG